MSHHSLIKKAIAECVGTALLVFVACSSIDFQAGIYSDLEISLAFGAVVMVAIVIFGDVSGAHINPAVSLAFAAIGKLKWRECALYLPAQLLGGAIGGYGVRFFSNDFLGQSVTSVKGELSLAQGFGIEFVISAFLMLTILGIADRPKAEKGQVAIVVGACVFMMALVFGPMTGASMNPARSFGPALAAGNFLDLWMYFAAPCLGCVSGALLWVGYFKKSNTSV